MKDTSAATVARAFYDNWAARYGTPLIITTDQGAQFESRLFTELLTVLGICRKRTASYHPVSNGMVERLHRDMKIDSADVPGKRGQLSAITSNDHARVANPHS